MMLPSATIDASLYVVMYIRRFYRWLGDLFFCPAYPLLKLGHHTELTETCLPPLSEENEPLEIRKQFWDSFLLRLHDRATGSCNYTTESPSVQFQHGRSNLSFISSDTPPSIVHSVPSLFSVLHNLATSTYYPLSVLLFITTLIGTLQPLVLKWILLTTDTEYGKLYKPSQNSSIFEFFLNFNGRSEILCQRIAAVFVLFLLSISGAVMAAQYGYHLTVLQARIRTALTLAIHDKILGTDIWHPSRYSMDICKPFINDVINKQGEQHRSCSRFFLGRTISQEVHGQKVLPSSPKKCSNKKTGAKPPLPEDLFLYSQYGAQRDSLQDSIPLQRKASDFCEFLATTNLTQSPRDLNVSSNQVGNKPSKKIPIVKTRSNQSSKKKPFRQPFKRKRFLSILWYSKGNIQQPNFEKLPSPRHMKLVQVQSDSETIGRWPTDSTSDNYDRYYCTDASSSSPNSRVNKNPLSSTLNSDKTEASFSRGLPASSIGSSVTVSKDMKKKDKHDPFSRCLISPRYFGPFNCGDIINLTTIDVERLSSVLSAINSFWQLPIDIIITLCLLYREVKSAFFVALIILVGVVIMNTVVVVTLSRETRTMMKWKDVRTSLMYGDMGSECILGMTTVKLLGLESALNAKIAKARSKEVSALRRRKYLDAICVYLWAATPVLTTSAMFCMLVIMDKLLTPSVCFTSLALLLRLVVPMNNIPWVLSSLIEARVSYARLSQFMVPTKNSNWPENIELPLSRQPRNQMLRRAIRILRHSTQIFSSSRFTLLRRSARSWRQPTYSSNTDRPVLSAASPQWSYLTSDAEPKSCVEQNHPVLIFQAAAFAPDEAGQRIGQNRCTKRRNQSTLFSRQSQLEFNTNRTTPVASISEFKLCNITDDVREGDLLIIVGQIGGGKSSFLKAVLGQTENTAGELLLRHLVPKGFKKSCSHNVSEREHCRNQICGSFPPRTILKKRAHDYSYFIPLESSMDPRPRIGYAPQTPWLKRSTIRNNIVGDFAFDFDRYSLVLQATGLSSDLLQLNGGDASPVGEEGCLLSGGQRSRIGLARALYPKDVKLYLLDDIFASLDAHVALNLTNMLFAGAWLDKSSQQRAQSSVFTSLTRRALKLYTKPKHIAARSSHFLDSPNLSQTSTPSNKELERSLSAKEHHISTAPLINPATSATILTTHSISFLRRLDVVNSSRKEAADKRDSKNFWSGPWFTRIRVLRLNGGTMDYLGPLENLPGLWNSNEDAQVESSTLTLAAGLASKCNHHRAHQHSGMHAITTFTPLTRSITENSPRSAPAATPFAIDIPLERQTEPPRPVQELFSISRTCRLRQPLRKTCSKLASKMNHNRRAIRGGNSEDTIVESTMVGVVERRVLETYLKAVGLGIVVAVIVMITFMQFFRSLSDLCLSYWISGKFPFQLFPFDCSRQGLFLSCYGVLAVLHSVMSLCRAFGFAKGGINAARKLHDDAWTHVLRGSISWFSSQPSSGLINRFSSDIWTVDDSLPFALNIVMTQAVALVGGVLTLGLACPLALVLLPLLAIIYLILQRFFKAASIQLRRLELASRPRILQHLNEAAKGGAVIRGLKSERAHLLMLIASVRRNLRIIISSQQINSWFAVRLDLIGAVLTATVALIAVLSSPIQPTSTLSSQRSSIQSSLVVLLLRPYKAKFSSTLTPLQSPVSDQVGNMRLLSRVPLSISRNEQHYYNSYHMKNRRERITGTRPNLFNLSTSPMYSLALPMVGNRIPSLASLTMLPNADPFLIEPHLASEEYVLRSSYLVLGSMSQLSRTELVFAMLLSSGEDTLESPTFISASSADLNVGSEGSFWNKSLIIKAEDMLDGELDKLLLRFESQAILSNVPTNFLTFIEDIKSISNENRDDFGSESTTSKHRETEDKDGTSSSTFVGLAISYAIPLVAVLNGLFHSCVDTERCFVSVERLSDFTETGENVEVPMENESHASTEEGPESKIRFPHKAPQFFLVVRKEPHILFENEYLCNSSEATAEKNVAFIDKDLSIVLEKFETGAESNGIIKNVELSRSKDRGRSEPLWGEIDIQGISIIYPGASNYALDLRNHRFIISEHPSSETDRGCRKVTHDCLGITGRTGSGKSSLINALLRLVKLDTGTIHIDGVPIDEIPLRKLRSAITTVPQQPVVFSGLTVRENLDPNNDYRTDENSLWEALKICGLDHVIRRHTKHLNAIVGNLSLEYTKENNEDQLELSHGEKQLLCFCRAILRRSRILILDEACSSVDAAHEAVLHDLLHRFKRSTSIIIISHRLDVIVNECEHVIVLEKGQMKEFGKPVDLLQTSSSYFSSLWSAQHVGE